MLLAAGAQDYGDHHLFDGRASAFGARQLRHLPHCFFLTWLTPHVKEDTSGPDWNTSGTQQICYLYSRRFCFIKVKKKAIEVFYTPIAS
jgi:hypothetical protein